MSDPERFCIVFDRRKINGPTEGLGFCIPATRRKTENDFQEQFETDTQFAWIGMRCWSWVMILLNGSRCYRREPMLRSESTAIIKSFRLTSFQIQRTFLHLTFLEEQEALELNLVLLCDSDLPERLGESFFSCSTRFWSTSANEKGIPKPKKITHLTRSRSILNILMTWKCHSHLTLYCMLLGTEQSTAARRKQAIIQIKQTDINKTTHWVSKMQIYLWLNKAFCNVKTCDL